MTSPKVDWPNALACLYWLLFGMGTYGPRYYLWLAVAVWLTRGVLVFKAQRKLGL